ncbi:hypothetical protein MHU86_9380 [Fragilaria crotonensis]|nr:hypothetical protein MHU86_9380 [Fragilaria crotonensis]
MEHSGIADDVAKDSSSAGIQEHDFAEEFSSDLPSMAMPSSAPSGSSPYASFFLPSASKVDDHDDRDVAHGASDSAGIKKLEHALPSEPMSTTGLEVIDSSERPPPVYASNREVTPGAFPVVPSSHNPTSSQTLRSRPRRSSFGRELTNEESRQDDGVPNSAGAYAGWNDSAREATESGLYTVEASLVSDGNDDETTIVAEAKSITVPTSMDFSVRFCWCGGCYCCTGRSTTICIKQFVIDVAHPGTDHFITGVPNPGADLLDAGANCLQLSFHSKCDKVSIDICV